MLASYLKIAYRSLLKNKTFSIINVLGLSIGLAACILIVKFVCYEFSFDNFQSKGDRIYRVINDRYQNGKQTQHSTYTYPAVGPTLAKDYPEIETFSRILVPGGDALIKVNNRNFVGDKCLFADHNFFSVFDFPLIKGDKCTVLAGGRSVVLSERIAKKYFQSDDPSKAIGMELYWGWGIQKQPFIVTGICRNIPENSHLQFDVLLSYGSLYSAEFKEPDESWAWSNVRHYLLLKPGADYKALESKFVAFCDRYFQGDKVTGSLEKLRLQPLHDIHLYSDYEYEYARTSNGKVVWIMILVAAVILVIACINYINLTVSRSIDRAKEVGVRKTMGAASGHLMKQFMVESLALSIFSLIIASTFVLIFQKQFNYVFNADLSFETIFRFIDYSTLGIFVLALLTGLVLSGFYPAFILSAYSPLTVLRGKFSPGSKGQFLRKGLIVFQFMISCALVTSALIISLQLDYMNKADLGLNIQRTLIVSPPLRTTFDSSYFTRVKTFKHALQQLEQVSHVATSSHIPGTKPTRAFGIQLKGEPGSTQYTMDELFIDEDFFNLYKIRILSGRQFEFSDCNFDWKAVDKVIINRKALDMFGQNADEIIGKKLAFANKLWTIIGVVENFHQQSLHNSIGPMLFVPDYGTSNPTSIKLRGENHQASLHQIQSLFEISFPDNAFNYSFLEDSFKNNYQEDGKFKRVIIIFTVLAIIISCMGLIGLSSFTAVQRTKEIGIRKVLGASIPNIISLLSINFIKLVVLATLLSMPLAYYSTHLWLMNFAYRFTPGIALFVLPIIAIVIIAFATISTQILKTARTNPADTLKYE